jgi:hypothetical protein
MPHQVTLLIGLSDTRLFEFVKLYLIIYMEIQSTNFKLNINGTTNNYRLSARLPLLLGPDTSPYFSFHGISNPASPSKYHVICAGIGGFYLSYDNGHRWTWISISEKSLERTRFINAWIASNGNFILQERGVVAGDVPDKLGTGRIVTLDPSFKVIAINETTRNQWHGSSSIDEQDGSIIFCDYALNCGITRDIPLHDRPFLSTVMRSIDFGLTWEKVFSIPDIRHFHVVRADPFKKGKWYLTSGDRFDECRVWISYDNGLSWENETDNWVSAGLINSSALRMTDLIFTPNGLFWGTDDTLGGKGSMLFSLNPEGANIPTQSYGTLGPEVRSLVDCGEILLVFCQSSSFKNFSYPTIWACEVENYENRTLVFSDINNSHPTKSGFTYSTSSRKLVNGTFFTRRGDYDLFGTKRIRAVHWVLESY